MSSSQRFCIFCGKAPENKNKEHVLPQWLLEFTGDPSRVVNHGTNWETGKLLSFSWDSFVFPACKDCNDQYHVLEGQASSIMKSICQDEPINSYEYIKLLDWFDKVRIGLWLGWRYHQGLTDLPRNFAISDRIAKKDRMIAVYPIGDHQPDGLNYFGPESPVFDTHPCAFALRVNNRLFINASWDWMCSKECGWPYPKKKQVLLDHGGMLHVSEFEATCSVDLSSWDFLPKPSVMLFQPIVHRSINGGYLTAQNFSDSANNQMISGPWGYGKLFRKTKNKVEILSPSDCFSFDGISGLEAVSANRITSEVYQIQLNCIDSYERTSEKPKKLSASEELMKIYREHNLSSMEFLRTNPKHQGAHQPNTEN